MFILAHIDGYSEESLLEQLRKIDGSIKDYEAKQEARMQDEISGQKEGKSKFCYQCSAKFYSNPSKPESRKKIREAQLRFYANGGKTWNKGLTAATNDILKSNG